MRDPYSQEPPILSVQAGRKISSAYGPLLLLAALLLIAPLTALAQDSYVGPAILPPAPNAIGGGNPFQGLGRSDDPGPSREKQFGFPTYNSSNFNANGMQDYPGRSYYSDSYAVYPYSESVHSNSNSNANSNFNSNPNFNANTNPSGENQIPAEDYNNGNNGVSPTSITNTTPGNISRRNYNYNTAAPTQTPVNPSTPPYFNLPPSRPFDLTSRLNANSNFWSGSLFNTRPNLPPSGRKHANNNNNNNNSTGSPDSANTELPAPPSVTPSSESADSNSESKPLLSPLASAVRDIKFEHYTDAMKTIDNLLQANSKNPDAHYLKAVISVLRSQFTEAKLEYQETLKYSHSDELSERARVGLNKLSH